MSRPEFAPAYQITGISGGQDPLEPIEPLPDPPPLLDDAFAPPREMPPVIPQHGYEPPVAEAVAEPAEQVAESPAEARAAARSTAALSAKVAILAERLRAQEQATARLQSTVERIEGSLAELTKRAQPMLETLSAELARQGALLEGLRTETESSVELHGQRVAEFEQRLAGVLREMRELVAGKLESYDLVVSDRMESERHALDDRLAGFEERVEDLVRRFAAAAIPEEMRGKVEDLSSRFVYAETALAATRSSVEFLRGEVGQLTMVVRRLSPGASD